MGCANSKTKYSEDYSSNSEDDVYKKKKLPYGYCSILLLIYCDYFIYKTLNLVDINMDNN